MLKIQSIRVILRRQTNTICKPIAHDLCPAGSHGIPLHSMGPLKIVNSEENIDIRRAAALVIANASSDSGNLAGEPRPWAVCVVGSPLGEI
jgi:hypothetical protein